MSKCIYKLKYYGVTKTNIWSKGYEKIYIATVSDDISDFVPQFYKAWKIGTKMAIKELNSLLQIQIQLLIHVMWRDVEKWMGWPRTFLIQESIFLIFFLSEVDLFDQIPMNQYILISFWCHNTIINQNSIDIVLFKIACKTIDHILFFLNILSL